MKSKIISACYLIVGLINFAPIMGSMGAARMEELYGVNIDGADLTLLMQHRALLFGIVGGFILYAVWQTAYRRIAGILGFISMVGFILLVHAGGATNPALMKIYWVDVFAIIILIVAWLLERDQSADA